MKSILKSMHPTPIIIILVFSINIVYASDEQIECINMALTSKDVNKCGDLLVPPREAKVDSEFKRLSERFRDNDEMQTMLRLTRQSWDNYRNLQCALEGALAAGGQTTGSLPVEGEKAFLYCVIRTLGEIESVLGKFQ